jgi:hypothetical protein
MNQGGKLGNVKSEFLAIIKPVLRFDGGNAALNAGDGGE